MTNMHTLVMRHCFVDDLPSSLAKWQKLDTLHLDGVPWVQLKESVRVLPWVRFDNNYLRKHRLQRHFEMVSTVGFTCLLFDFAQRQSFCPCEMK